MSELKGATEVYKGFLGNQERLRINNMSETGCVGICTEPDAAKPDCDDICAMILPNEIALKLAYWIINNIPIKETK